MTAAPSAAPPETPGLPENLRIEELEPGKPYLVTLPPDATPASLRDVRDRLQAWVRRPDHAVPPPQFFVRRADVDIDLVLPTVICPQCGAEVRRDAEEDEVTSQ